VTLKVDHLGGALTRLGQHEASGYRKDLLFDSAGLEIYRVAREGHEGRRAAPGRARHPLNRSDLPNAVGAAPLREAEEAELVYWRASSRDEGTDLVEEAAKRLRIMSTSGTTGATDDQAHLAFRLAECSHAWARAVIPEGDVANRAESRDRNPRRSAKPVL